MSAAVNSFRQLETDFWRFSITCLQYIVVTPLWGVAPGASPLPSFSPPLPPPPLPLPFPKDLSPCLLLSIVYFTLWFIKNDAFHFVHSQYLAQLSGIAEVTDFLSNPASREWTGEVRKGGCCCSNAVGFTPGHALDMLSSVSGQAPASLNTSLLCSLGPGLFRAHMLLATAPAEPNRWEVWLTVLQNICQS